jgi:hypothetical protein
MTIALTRRPDWAVRLHDFVDAVKRNAFDWASQNCAEHFAAGAVLAMTDIDIAAEYRGSYKTARGAAQMMKRKGFDNLADMLGAHLPEITGVDGEPFVGGATLGDIAAIPKDDAFGFTLGIVNGEMILVLGETGMGTVPLFNAARAFRV